jgi:hypothetical protein
VGQIAPVGIIFFDQARLPVAVPIPQLLLASDRFPWRRERLHMDEAIHTILFDEFRTSAAAMLPKPDPEIVRDANVERSVPTARENVNVICACCAHRGAFAQERQHW